MLHILTKAPDSDAARQMQQAIADDDAIVLIEAGVQAALHTQWDGWALYESRVYLLAEDITAWGLDEFVDSREFATIDMQGFIGLTEQHTQTVTWY
ncbi:sulfurtransferase complex subunit TusB [Vreelandella populi]|uniref:Sulfurtransferase complex subunit TusB n=1 Tax=Vreelandella populi TaxID=2498858 RepID=A0A3S0WL77_9GAMM|nr:sulfurtransferase complex subunit TusB [Halomonas populi]RUR38478.1 sulfurtransferase complex subunit TusB [Halomonas populi]RUR43482.1 sulfurtransferase complex subunit TusB [Halomonas populi]RUR51629.1 sulfurtransferase complex subunit TusB [Halomonas populi]